MLLVTATAGYRHSSIETAEEVMAALVPNLEVARDERAMSDAFGRLDQVHVTMFANTTGDLEVEGRQKLLEWIAAGGTFIGVHSAADTWHEWPEYLDMLGGEFDRHPEQTTGTVFVESQGDPSTRDIASTHSLFEEFYLFRRFDPARVQLLLSLHMSPENGAPGVFPLSWRRPYGQGRVFYTALGHREDVWTSLWFQQHLLGAMA